MTPGGRRREWQLVSRESQLVSGQWLLVTVDQGLKELRFAFSGRFSQAGHWPCWARRGAKTNQRTVKPISAHSRVFLKNFVRPPSFANAIGGRPDPRIAWQTTQILVFSRRGEFSPTEKANGHAPHRIGFAAKPCACMRVGAQCNPFAEEKKRRSLLPRRTFSAVSPTRLAGGLSQRILVDHPPDMWPRGPLGTFSEWKK